MNLNNYCLSKEIITEALAELPDSNKLWGDIIRCMGYFYAHRRVYINDPSAVVSGLYLVIKDYAEQEALRQIRREQDQPPPEDNDAI